MILLYSKEFLIIFLCILKKKENSKKNIKINQLLIAVAKLKAVEDSLLKLY
jgi:hypothetical protein